MRSLVLLATLLATAAGAQTALGGPAGHRLLLTPTARAIPAGDARVGVTEVVVPTAAVGFGKGVSLGAGVLALPDRNVAGVLFAEPKWTLVDREDVAVAVGMAAQARLFYRPQGTAMPFAVATVGSGRTVGTVGLGARVNVVETPVLVTLFDWPDDAFFQAPARDDYTTYLVRAPVAWAGIEAQASTRVTVVAEVAALPSQPLDFAFETGCCIPTYDYDVVRGDVRYHLTVGAAARVQAGPAAFDLGLILGRDGSDLYYDESPLVLLPWLSATVGL